MTEVTAGLASSHLIASVVGFLAMLGVFHVGELALLRDAVRRRPLRAADDPA